MTTTGTVTQPHHMDRVVQLSQLIQEHADKLSARVKKHATSSLSLESGVPEVLETDTVAIEARRAIDEYATELQAIVKGPQSIIMAPAVSSHYRKFNYSL